jgi:DNA (cytosine-5)-methyltransferase 1
MGYDAEWGVFSAADVGAFHLRERIWILANANEIGFRRRRHSEKTRNQRIQPARLVGKSGAWETAPAEKARILGMGDGLAFGMDRIAAIGNGQVPAVVELAWKTLMARLCSR